MRQFYALAPGTGRFRNSCYFGNLLLSGEQIPPFGGLWNEGCARQYGMAGSLQTACGRPERRFSGTAENIRTGKPLSRNQSPFIFPERLRQSRPGGVQRPVPHTGPSPDTPASPEFPLLSIGLPENSPSISSFSTSRALILRAGSFKAAAPVPCAAEKGFHFTNGNQDTRFRDSLNRRRNPPVRDRLRCGFS